MATPVVPIITTVGIAAAAAAAALSESITITHVALGDATYTPTSAATALTNRREVATIADGADNGDGTLTITALFKAEDYAGALYSVQEVGFYIGDPDAGGTLFALYSATGWICAWRDAAADVDFAASYTLALTAVPAGSVTVTVDPIAGFDVDIMRIHVAAAHPHPHYVRNDAAQGLDDTQKTQARSNIGAASAVALDSYVKHDAVQTLAGGNQTQARANIGAAADAEVIKKDGSVAMTAELTLFGTASTAQHAVPLAQATGLISAAIAAEADPIGAAGAAVAAHVSAYPHLGQVFIQGLIDASVAVAVRACRPLGQVFGHFGASAPSGALICAGQVLSRADYPALWAKATADSLVVTDTVWIAGSGSHTLFSSGDGSTTFRMPRLGGEFMRFADNGAGVDAGRAVGSFQDWATAAPKTTSPAPQGFLKRSNVGESVTSTSVFDDTNSGTEMNLTAFGAGDSETRPRSVALLACMWY